MEIGLGVHAPSTGARADVVLRAPEGTCVGDVAGQLLASVLPAGSTGSLSVGGAVLPPSTLLGQPPVLHGALLQVGAGRPALPATCALHVVAGPDAGRVHLLSPGEVDLGRDPAAAVQLADDDASRLHCRLRVSHDSTTVVDLASTNGTTLDGRPVGQEPVPLAPGAVLRVGRSLLTLTRPEQSPAPGGAASDGRIAHARPPRLTARTAPPTVLVPPPPADREREPLPFVAVLTPLLLGLGMWRLTGSTTYLLLTLLSPLLVVGQLVTDRRSGSRRSRRERAQWRESRDAAEQSLAAAVEADEHARRQQCPDPAQALVLALTRHSRVWERRRSDDDVLQLRVGVADQPARVEAEGDVQPAALTARDVPVVVPLREVGVLGVAGPAARALARWLVAQAAVWHSPRDLQIVVLAEPAAAAEWEWPRWLPHTLPDAGQDCAALLGLTPTQAAARVRELTALVAARRERSDGRGPARPVLLVVDGARSLRALPGLTELLSEGPAANVLAVCVEPDGRLLPEECSATVEADTRAEMSLCRSGFRDLVDGTADLVSVSWAETLARALAPLHDHGPAGAGAADLPARLRWTQVAGLPLTGGSDDVARVVSRWSAEGRCTRALLGRSPHGDLVVDLDRDGPHALVAGTTGSGKSELLQTLIASLALENRPDQLTFVLVDYKGGAAFGPCAGLPHTVGMVTDLDGTLVERALASLTAELSRREAVLAKVGAKDIEDHRRRSDSAQALPRLVIVVDEFASLAEELPDFVRGLVGIAMRGRSLGVHLVLATQRPEGVVSADIRANTNLRLCLAVTREGESRDVLDSPVAARIPRSAPGRGYVRTGHAELTPFQTARVGGRRPAADGRGGAVEVELLPGAAVGDPLPRKQIPEDLEETSDLALLVQACRAAAAQVGVREQPSPWLPPLPSRLLLDQLPSVADPLAGQAGRVPAASYGLVDLPAEQAQRPLTLDLDTATHLRVVGTARTGRTSALRAIAAAVASAASPDDVHLYALDLGGGGLAALGVLPHTGAVVPRDQPQRLERLLTWLGTEVTRRQAQLAAGGHAGIPEQRAATEPADRLPHLLLLVDGWEAFLAAFQDIDAGRLVDLAHRLLREGPSAGLHVVLTTDRGGLLGRAASLVDDTLLLRLADRSDYAAAGVRAALVPSELPPGRGWSVRHQPLPAQVALLDPQPTGPAQAAALARLGQACPPPRHHRPRRVEPLPALVRLAGLAGQEGRVVLGVGGDELDPVRLDIDDLGQGFLIAGPASSGRSTLLAGLARQLVDAGLPVLAFAPRPSALREVDGLLGCVTDRAGVEPPRRGPVALLVDDAELLVDSPVGDVLEQAVRQARDTGALVVAAGSTDALLTGYRGFVVELRRSRTGLLLSPQSPADGDLLGLRLPRSAIGEVQAGRGLLVRRGTTLPLQVALPG